MLRDADPLGDFKRSDAFRFNEEPELILYRDENFHGMDAGLFLKVCVELIAARTAGFEVRTCKGKGQIQNFTADI